MTTLSMHYNKLLKQFIITQSDKPEIVYEKPSQGIKHLIAQEKKG
jgi:hypothetical protein